MEALTKEKILKADDLKTEKVDVPEWGGSVFVRSLTGTEREEYEVAVSRKENATDLRARLCALTIVDKEGKRVFDAKDIPALGSKSVAALIRVFRVSQKLNGLGEDDIKDLAKN